MEDYAPMPVAYFSSDEETMPSSQATADNFAHDRKQEAEANHTEKDRKSEKGMETRGGGREAGRRTLAAAAAVFLGFSD